MAGGALGMLLGAMFLAVMAIRGFSFECGELTPNECALELGAVRDLARWQGMTSAALALLAGGVLLYVRAKRRSSR
jgi:hypothetical protein